MTESNRTPDDHALDRIVDIPDSLERKYALAKTLGLDLNGISQEEVHDRYPEQEYPFWDGFIEKERQQKAKKLSDSILDQYIQENCDAGCSKRVRSMMRASYFRSPEYQQALNAAREQDDQWQLLMTARPGEESLEMKYLRYHAEVEKQRIGKQDAIITEALVRYNMDFVKAYAEKHFTQAYLEFFIEEQANMIIHTIEEYLLHQRKLYVPESLYEDDGSYCASSREIDSEYLLEDLPDEEEAFLLSLFYESTGAYSPEMYVLEALFRDIEAMCVFAKVRCCRVMKEAFEDSYREPFLDVIYGSGVMLPLYGHFIAEAVLDILLLNPYYSDMASFCLDKLRIKQRAQRDAFQRKKKEAEDKSKRLEAINAEIMERIPDSYKDLYPAARSMKRRFVLHLGPTNSGKTYSALKAYREANSGVYLGPLRLLAYEVYEATNHQGVPCSMITGEEELITDGAFHFAQTIETMSETMFYDVAVIDEAQMIADRQRGGAWTEAILGLCAEEIHVCAAPEAEDILISLIEHCGDSYSLTRHERFTPLRLEASVFSFPADVQEGDALIVFSRNAVLAYAERLRAMGIPVSMIYGALPYDVRRQEVEKFLSRETKVAVATDCIGMGLNLPVRRVVFLEDEKYDGTSVRRLHYGEIMQIAGRAGRFGIFEEGACATAESLSYFKNAFQFSGSAIQNARLSFPKRLISVEGKLSEIISCWNGNKTAAPFVKTDLSREKALCAYLERFTQDKSVIYSLITIPFNEKNESVARLWEQIATKRCKGLPLEWRDFQSVLSYPTEHNATSPNDLLRKLEAQYQICDLLYYCYNRFAEGAERTTRKAELLERKAALSEMINSHLAQFRKKKKPRKKEP